MKIESLTFSWSVASQNKRSLSQTLLWLSSVSSVEVLSVTSGGAMSEKQRALFHRWQKRGHTGFLWNGHLRPRGGSRVWGSNKVEGAGVPGNRGVDAPALSSVASRFAQGERNNSVFNQGHLPCRLVSVPAEPNPNGHIIQRPHLEGKHVGLGGPRQAWFTAPFPSAVWEFAG